MRPYIRALLYFATALVFAIACTKEITLFTEVEFELSIVGEQEGYVNQLLPTTISVTPEENLEGYEYSYSYTLLTGNGYFEDRTGEVLPEGEKLSLQPLSASMMFRSLEMGEHVVKISAEDNFGFTEEAELTYTVTNVPVVWTASPGSGNMEVNEEFTITLVLDTADADAEVTYESRYSLASGSGTLTGLPATGDVVSQEFRPISAGSYSLGFTPDTVGETVLIFDLRDSNGQELSVSVSLEVFEEGTLVAVTGLIVLPESADLEIGETQQLTAEIIPDNAMEQGVVWSSENTAIATVDANGRVTAVSAGTVSINAVSVDDSTIRDSATLTISEATINQPPTANDDTISTGADEGVNILVLQNDTDVDTPVEQLTITAVSAVTPNGAATVSINGSAISFEPTAGVTGEVTFTYTINDGNPGNDAAASVTVNVMENIIPVTGITVTPATATIAEGGNRQLDATVSPSDATEQSVVWSSGNTAIATVDNNGRVTAVAPGQAVIAVTSVYDNTITDSSIITVEATAVPVTGMSVNSARTEINDDETEQFTATTTPSNASNTNVNWSSSNTAVATVNINTGLVTAVAAGTTNIVATATDGSGVSGSRTLTVNTTEVLVSGITVTRDRSSILDNETEPFTAIVAPVNATDSSVTWSSSNTSVATVNASTGLVSAVASGNATITATANDGSNITGSAGITVTASEILVESITVSSLRSSIPDDETEQFNAAVTPGNATDQSVTWSSSNTGVATVNSTTGFVTAVMAGTTNITATANDGSGVSGLKAFTVTDSNTVPTASNFAITVDENSDVTFDIVIQGNVQDIDGDGLTITITPQPSNGAVSPVTGNVYRYIPNTDETGSDSFGYRVDDGRGGIVNRTISVMIAPVNNPPDAVNDSRVVQNDRSTTVTVLSNDNDPDGDTLSLTNSFSQPSSGSIARTSSGTGDRFIYTPVSRFTGNVSFSYQISDGNGEFDSATVSLRVTDPIVDGGDCPDPTDASDPSCPCGPGTPIPDCP